MNEIVEETSESEAVETLSTIQSARVSALYHARSALEERKTSGGFAGGVHSVSGSDELLAVAEWIMSGEMWMDDAAPLDGEQAEKTLRAWKDRG